MHSKTSGSIIVYMDDDDYYPPERVSHAVDVLQQNRNALCWVQVDICLFQHINGMYQMNLHMDQIMQQRGHLHFVKNF